MSHSPDDVAAGYCGACHEVTRIEGLTVVLEPRDGEFECGACGQAFVTPPSHRGSVLCQCGALMRERLVPVCYTSGPLSPEALEQARAFGGSAVPQGEGWTLRENGPQRTAWARSPGPLSWTPAYTARDYYRLARDAVRGPESAAERARALLDRMRCSSQPETDVRGPADGWTYLGASGGEMFWAEAPEFSFDVPQQSYEELAAETVANLQSLAGASVTVEGTLSAEQLTALLGLLPADGEFTGTLMRDDANAARPAPDESLLGQLTTAEIDRLLARNQTVMEGLIVNHSAPRSDEDAKYPWTDPATWSPGDAEL